MSSSRETIGLGLEALLPTIIDSSTSLALFQEVKLGNILDPTGLASFAEITHYQGQSGPAGSGGNVIGWRIQDQIAFQISCGVPYETDTRTATLASLHIQDVLLEFLHAHPKVPNPNDPTFAIASVYSLLEDHPDRSRPVPFPNGKVYLMWWTFAVVQQQYNVTLVQQ
jgi:hypothetical protein